MRFEQYSATLFDIMDPPAPETTLITGLTVTFGLN